MATPAALPDYTKIVRATNAAVKVEPALDINALSAQLEAVTKVLLSVYDPVTGYLKSSALADTLTLPDGLAVTTTRNDGGHDTVVTDATFKTYATGTIGLTTGGGSATNGSAGGSTNTTTAPATYVTATVAKTTNDPFTTSQLTLAGGDNSFRLNAVIDSSQTGYSGAKWKKLSAPAGDVSVFQNNDLSIAYTYVQDMNVVGVYTFQRVFIDSTGVERASNIITVEKKP